jgi:hypothetical protein
MEGHKGVVSALMVEGQLLMSGSWDGTIRLWWHPDHSPLANFGGGSNVSFGGIHALMKCSANGLLFSGHDSGVIQVGKFLGRHAVRACSYTQASQVIKIGHLA